MNPQISMRAGKHVAALVLLAACASTPPPRDVLASAESALGAAEKAGAPADAPLAVRKSRDQLEIARHEMQEERYVEARRSAETAEVEAQYAIAEARRVQAERALKELSLSVRALQEEIDHGQH